MFAIFFVILQASINSRLHSRHAGVQREPCQPTCRTSLPTVMTQPNIDFLLDEAVALLMQLIALPSTSRDEGAAADAMQHWMEERGLRPFRLGNNIILVCPGYDAARPTLLLNAHIDTVRPVATWTRDPYAPLLEGDSLYGLGSNDCGGGLVTLLQAYRVLAETPRAFNVVYVASAEEEVSGAEGMSRVVTELPSLLSTPAALLNENVVAVVGEPTAMQPAVAEKGLMVVDVIAHGVSGHAARGEGRNAIYEALDDMQWIRLHSFAKVSPFLGATRMTLTVVNAGTQHNVIPDECRMVVDVRSNELYTNEEIYGILCENLHSEVKPRSFRLRSSRIDVSHPLVQRCVAMGMQPFGSPTLSDQALMPWTSLKLGPGESSRSHTADEFIRISEMRHALGTYLSLADGLTLA